MKAPVERRSYKNGAVKMCVTFGQIHGIMQVVCFEVASWFIGVGEAKSWFDGSQGASILARDSSLLLVRLRKAALHNADDHG